MIARRFPVIIYRHLPRPSFLEMEFLSAAQAIGWALVAFGTRVDMAQRPSLDALRWLSDDAWALIVGVLGVIQMGCVLVNTRWGRWLVSIPLSFFWGMVVVAVMNACLGDAEMPLAFGLYVPLALCMTLKVARLPKEFPPRGR